MPGSTAPTSAREREGASSFFLLTRMRPSRVWEKRSAARLSSRTVSGGLGGWAWSRLVSAQALPALHDQRGERDREGRMLEVTQFAVAGLLVSAAALATGEGAEGMPAVLVGGYLLKGEPCPATALTRPIEEDQFQ